MIRVLIGLFLVLLVGTACWFFFFRGEPIKKVAKEGPIIFFGNSLTAGSGAGEGEDFPSVVTKKLNLKNVINAGVGGVVGVLSGSQCIEQLERVKHAHILSSVGALPALLESEFG